MNNYSSQAYESLHQWIKTFAKHNITKQRVRTCSVSIVVRARVEQADGPAIQSQVVGMKREAIGHMKKDKKVKHSKAMATEAIGCKNEKVEAANTSL